MSNIGSLFVIAAPSGTGKTTLVKELIDTTDNIVVSISHTTRQQRPAEQHGINYYFIDQTDFEKMIKNNEFLEHAKVFNYFYGTSRKMVEESLGRGIDVVLEIDWQGCQQVQQLYPDCISIFILPPSVNSLAERLISRNQDKVDIIQQRLADARETVSHIPEYDYLIVNDNFSYAVTELQTIVKAERLRQKKQSQKYSDLIACFLSKK